MPRKCRFAEQDNSLFECIQMDTSEQSDISLVTSGISVKCVGGKNLSKGEILGAKARPALLHHRLGAAADNIPRNSISNPRNPRQSLFQQRAQRLALIQISIAKIGAELIGVGNDFQNAVAGWGGIAQVLGGADVVGGGAGQAVQTTIEQVLEDAFRQALVLPQIARQPHGNPLACGEACDDFTDGPNVVHLFMGVQVTGAQAVVQAALPLGFEFFRDCMTILATQPEAAAGQVQVECAGNVAEGPARENAPAQRAATAEVEVQADAPLQQRMQGQGTRSVKGRHVGHDGGGTDDPGLERSQNHRVFTGTEAEIVSVDYDLVRHIRPP